MNTLMPPFKLAAPPRQTMPGACDESHDHGPAATESTPSSARRRLTDLDGHLHCSVIGTCLGTGELRKLMARHFDVQDASDLDVHHETVRLVGDGGAVARAVQKALDQKHDGALRQAARVRGAAALLAWWKEALGKGEVPGAYWAVMTHRDATFDTLKDVFGDVHMLSHLVGSANRADIRRLAALEVDNATLQRSVETLRRKLQDVHAEHAGAIDALEQRLVVVRQGAAPRERTSDAERSWEAEAALQRERCERQECLAREAQAEASLARAEADALRERLAALETEMTAVERALASDGSNADLSSTNVDRLRDRRILYVGGRPGATNAIRDWVVRHGGSFRGHDGGLEDRKGLLASAVAGADLVLFPVDCIDHDSVGNLKRLCGRLQVPFVPLRSAGVGSFVAAMSAAAPAIAA